MTFYQGKGRAERMLDRIQAGVQTLAYEAENATAVLEERGYAGNGDEADAFAGRHADAALAAQAYADNMRATIEAGGYVDLDAAERVAQAAELGGILIDGRPLDQAQAESGSSWNAGMRDDWNAGTSPAQQKAAEIEGTGAFSHVAQDGQVPFYTLSTSPDTTAELTTINTDSDGMSA